MVSFHVVRFLRNRSRYAQSAASVLFKLMIGVQTHQPKFGCVYDPKVGRISVEITLPIFPLPGGRQLEGNAQGTWIPRWIRNREIWYCEWVSARERLGLYMRRGREI